MYRSPLILIIAVVFIYGSLAVGLFSFAIGLFSSDSTYQDYCYNFAAITVIIGVLGSFILFKIQGSRNKKIKEKR